MAQAAELVRMAAVHAPKNMIKPGRSMTSEAMLAVAELPGRKYPTKIFLFSLRGAPTVTDPDDFMQERAGESISPGKLGRSMLRPHKSKALRRIVVQEKKRKRGATKTDG